MDFMTIITKIAAIATMTVIQEYDPGLLDNRILNDVIDVIVVVCTLAVKVGVHQNLPTYPNGSSSLPDPVDPVLIPVHRVL